MLPEEYEDLSAEELSDEIKGLDALIEKYQKSITQQRKAMNSNIELREKLYELYKLKSQEKGWAK